MRRVRRVQKSNPKKKGEERESSPLKEKIGGKEKEKRGGKLGRKKRINRNPENKKKEKEKKRKEEGKKDKEKAQDNGNRMRDDMQSASTKYNRPLCFQGCTNFVYEFVDIEQRA
jgi:hypothetical protein